MDHTPPVVDRLSFFRFTTRSSGVKNGQCLWGLILTLLAFFASSGALAASSLLVSDFPDRSGSELLAGSEAAGLTYIFVGPEEGVKQVDFFLDEPPPATPWRTERKAPFDFNGTASGFTAKAFNTETLTDGQHTLYARVVYTNGVTEILSAAFTVNNSGAVLLFDTDALNFSAVEGESSTQTLGTLLTGSGSTSSDFTVTFDAAWLSVSPASGTVPATISITAASEGLAAGDYVATVTAEAEGHVAGSVRVKLSVVQPSGAQYPLVFSTDANRSSPATLEAAQAAGIIYVFVPAQPEVKRIEFYIDDPARIGAPFQSEGKAPYDLAGTEGNGDAIPFDTGSLVDGIHSVTAYVRKTDNSFSETTSYFTVDNTVAALSFSETELGGSRSVDDPGVLQQALTLSASEGAAVGFVLTSDVPWLSAGPDSGTTPANFTITANTNGLTAGSYSGTLTATSGDYQDAQLNYTLTVTDSTPVLAVSPTSLAFEGIEGAIITAQTVVISSTEGGAAEFAIAGNAPWLSATPASSTTPSTVEVSVNTTGLAAGSYTDELSIVSAGEVVISIPVSLTITDALVLTFSETNLSGSRSVTNPGVSEHTVTLAAGDTGQVGFSLSADAPWLEASPASGTTPATLTVTADSSGLDVGTYLATLTATASGYEDTALTYTLTVSSSTGGTTGLVVSPETVSFLSTYGEPVAGQSLTVSGSDGQALAFTVSTNVPWLTATPANGTSPSDVQVAVDATGLAIGNYQAILTLTPTSYPPVDVPVSFSLISNDKCAPVVCEEVRIELPYQLSFSESQGHLMDRNGWGTGFTWIDLPSQSSGYLPENLEMKFLEGTLELTTTSGIAFSTNNSQDNALGVGFAAPNQVTRISTRILGVPTGTGNYEQAGLWFGNDEDNYIKLVVSSEPSGPQVHYLMEVNGATAKKGEAYLPTLPGKNVDLVIVVDPFERSVSLSYKPDGSASSQLGLLTPPDEFFSFDAAGIDPEIGTRSFAGIFATHRRGSAPLVYRFNEFSVVEGSKSVSGDSGLDFIRKSYAISFPTSMVWAPDDRLYVTELFGTVHAMAFDAEMNVTEHQTFDTLINDIGPRLTLGITVGPDSTSTNVDLWLAHSSPSIDNGEPNSGMVTRLSGPEFASVEHVITGLPRAIANHSVNSIHFGPSDRRLYIAVGGNTGAGAPNDANTEFGDREEQPLSAAIVVADVFAADFDGSCANATDIYGTPPCDVVTFATGLRNSYDFVFHSNGNMFATDNGLGVTGTFPPSPEPACLGLASTTSYLQGGHNPGSQPDLLHWIKEGKYYGHPNPHRDECVFKDGSFQGVAIPASYEEPIFNMGKNKSSNGITEYSGGEGCVGDELNAALLIANYSLGDDVFRVRLDETGNGVLGGTSLVSGFTDPLPVATNPEGIIFVGEFGGDKVTALRPVSLGCWSTGATSPTVLLDAAGAAVDGKAYVIGGKNGSGHLSTLFVYDPVAETWGQGADLPGAAVENPAAVVLDGRIYVFGGSTDPFSGAVDNAAVYTPATGNWDSLSPMPTARGGAAAQVIDGKIYVVGGMGSSSESLAVMEIYDPATDTWSSGASLTTRRDNAGLAAMDGKLYIFGGRIRNVDGSTENGTLQSTEMFDPTVGVWSEKAPMPTGRRTFSLGSVGGKAQIIGGELNPNSPSGVFAQSEEYDPATDSWRALVNTPAPKHGAATATIGDRVFVIGGGVSSGSSYTSSVDILSF